MARPERDVTVEVRLEARDLVREDVYRAFGGFGGLLWLGSVAAGAWLLTQAARGGGALSPTVLGVVGGVVFVVPFALLALVPWGAWRSYRANRSLQVPTTITLSEEGIRTTSELSAGFLAWGAVRDWRESPWALHLYVGRHLRIVLPKRAFEGAQGVQEATRLIDRHIA